MATRLASVVVSVMMAAALVGCGGDKPQDGPAGGDSSTAPAGASPTVQVKQFTFGPKSLTVPVGTKVTWRFEDSAKHNVKASDGSFGSEDLSDGQTFEHTFDKPGTYDYICSLHQYMTGSVTVQ